MLLRAVLLYRWVILASFFMEFRSLIFLRSITAVAPTSLLLSRLETVMAINQASVFGACILNFVTCRLAGLGGHVHNTSWSSCYAQEHENPALENCTRSWTYLSSLHNLAGSLGWEAALGVEEGFLPAVPAANEVREQKKNLRRLAPVNIFPDGVRGA